MEVVTIIIQVIELLCILLAIGFAAYKIYIVLRPVFGNSDFWKKALELVGEAEEQYEGNGRGAEKLNYVVSKLLLWCAERGIAITEADLTRVINLIVAAVNVIKKFTKSGG